MNQKYNVFVYEPNYDDTLTVTKEDGGLYISVAEEKAMDSYNTTIECTIFLPKDIVAKLLEFID